MSETTTEHESTSVAILGGGISGLTATWELHRQRPNWDISLFEADNRLGGVLQTTRQQDFLIEHSADNFIANEAAPWAKEFCVELGLESELIPTNSEFRRAMIWHGGKMHPVPEGFQLMKPGSLWSIAKSNLLSPLGKIRLAAERFVPTRNETDDESFESFAIRRLGKQAYERMVQPLVAGIYTADPKKLSMQAALPQFAKMEQEYGSLVSAARKQKRSSSDSGARYNIFWSLKNGMQSMLDAIQNQLDKVNIHLNSPVERLHRNNQTWQLHHRYGVQSFDAVIIALPTHQAAKICADQDDKLGTALGGIPHASSTIMCVGYHQDQFSKPLNAFGCVVPTIAGRKILAISYSSMKFPHRAPTQHHLLRVFVGGALQPELAELDDRETQTLVETELKELLGIRGQPVLHKIVRWKNAMPQYHIDHRQRVDDIQQTIGRLPNLAIAGNGLTGVGLPQCICSGQQAADHIVRSVASKSGKAATK